MKTIITNEKGLEIGFILTSDNFFVATPIKGQPRQFNRLDTATGFLWACYLRGYKSKNEVKQLYLDI